MSQRTANPVSRRTALAQLSAGGLGIAVAATVHSASAQDATPAPMTGHPMVGTWVVDRDIATMDDAPSIVVYTADGGLIDPSMGVAGVWMATGPRSAAWTLVAILDGGAGGYLAVRSTGEIDETGNALDGPASVTIVAPDGTVVMSSEGMSHYIRLQVEPVEAGGTALTGFPTWTPAPPADATPSA